MDGSCDSRSRLTIAWAGDFGYYAFGKSRIAYAFAGFMLMANNILLIGFHILTGAKILNTLSDHSLCTVVFSVICTIMGVVLSVPRTLHHVSFMSMFSCEFSGGKHQTPRARNGANLPL